jgi:2-keto-3-deoxy-6-phosphogluconate aldolase
MIALTSELEQKIKQNGGTIHYVTLEEFQEIMSKGTVLSNQEVQENILKNPNFLVSPAYL